MSEPQTAQERYDEQIASRHGGWGGYGSEAPPEFESAPSEEASPAQFDQGEGYYADPGYYEPQEGGYDPAVDFGEADEAYQEPVDYEGIAREALDDEFGLSEHEATLAEADARHEERLAQQGAPAEQQDAADLAGLVELIDSSPRLRGHGGELMRQYGGEFHAQVVSRLADYVAGLEQQSLAAGFSRENVAVGLAQNERRIVDAAIAATIEARSIADMKAQVQQHFSRGQR